MKKILLTILLVFAFLMKSQGQNIGLLRPTYKSKVDTLPFSTYYLNDEGDFFEGKMLSDKTFIGIGIYHWEESNQTYVGEFKDNQGHGRGTLYYNDKKNKRDRYEGDWKEGYMHGRGKMYMKNGKIFEVIMIKGEVKAERDISPPLIS